MASKAVAVAGDVAAEPAEGWTASPLVVLTHPRLSIGGDPVAYKATCTFTETSSGSTLPGLLEASGTSLTHGSVAVLRDGDSSDAGSGNMISVSSSRSLESG